MINRSLGNFSEYALKSSFFVSQCRSPKFLSETFLNANIHRQSPNFEIGSLERRNKQ